MQVRPEPSGTSEARFPSGVPAVSVVLAVYKPRADYFRDAIASVLSQSLGEIELVIVQEENEPIAQNIVNEFSDWRLRLVTNPVRRGLGAALNFGIAQSRSELVARMDADDIAEHMRLEWQRGFLLSHPEIDVVGSQLTIIDERNEVIGSRRYPTGHDAIRKTLQRYNCLAHPAVMFRKPVIQEAGGYREATLNEDFELWCRLVASGRKLANLSEPLLRYRSHHGALKYDQIHQVVRVGIEIKKRYFGDELGARARLRLLGERFLLMLPPVLVMFLFKTLVYAKPKSALPFRPEA